MIAIAKPVLKKRIKQMKGNIDNLNKIRSVDVCLRRLLALQENGIIRELKIRIRFKGISNEIVRWIKSLKDINSTIIYLRNYLMMLEDETIKGIEVILEYVNKIYLCPVSSLYCR